VAEPAPAAGETAAGTRGGCGGGAGKVTYHGARSVVLSGLADDPLQWLGKEGIAPHGGGIPVADTTGEVVFVHQRMDDLAVT
jgi:hypothetical protein